jgi:antitoxin (DNA-binding transcriptional repressor) of toxin-antitoxin stability system
MLRNENARIIEEVAQGQSFVVTRNGDPMAELSPIRKSRSTFIRREELASFVGVGPKIDSTSLCADLDAVVSQDLDSSKGDSRYVGADGSRPA